MNRGFRQIALLLMFVFTANIQAWALTVDNGMSHDSSVNTHLVTQQSNGQQHESQNCDKTEHHCCHAFSHLLGQVSDSFALNKLSKESRSFPVGIVNATSTHPEGIYRPPRNPSLT